MLIDIKELRDSTGMTQKEFASRYGIPISTLRKWEQGESSPAPYVAALLARTLPDTESSLKRIKTRGGKTYYYNPAKKEVSDVKGNRITIQEDLEGVKEQKLALYLEANSFCVIPVESLSSFISISISSPWCPDWASFQIMYPYWILE